VGCDVAMKLFEMDDRIKDTPPELLSRTMSRGMSENYKLVASTDSQGSATTATNSVVGIGGDNNV